jgi:transaldolase/glucose-6-phosphate isomerase
MANPLIDVQKFGQSIWYDNIRRGLITSGELQALVDSEGVLGVTSNPAIFEKAMAGSTDYDQATKALVNQGLHTSKEIYERLAVEDIQLACDVLYPVFLGTEGRDGYLSMEVSPYLAHDTKGTIEEARRLKQAIGRDNVMIKVPATPEGIPAIVQLISEGISVNVTLLFAVEAYDQVARAYIAGLEKLARSGGNVNKVASVASFFISRIDSLVDERVSQVIDRASDPKSIAALEHALGKTAIANAKLAYARYLEIKESDAWRALAARGARPQRLLWASTGTKNPKYAKTIYVDELIAAETVNTVPAETLRAFKSEGRPRSKMTEDWAEGLDQAQELMVTLASVGIHMEKVAAELLEDGLRKFCDAFDDLLEAVERKREAVLGGALDKQTSSLGDANSPVMSTIKEWRVSGKVRRLWAGDSELWTGLDEDRWLGWMHIVDGQREHLEYFRRLTDDIVSMEAKHVVVLGMGGSSLCPDVLRRTFGVIRGSPELLVLDSTVPAQVKSMETKIDIRRTVFIVSSKSGGTTEPNVFKQYFFDKVKKAIGEEQAGSRFIAITDPDTKMYRIATEDRFRHIALGVPSIGGRYSALSHFGMVPAALMGIGLRRFLDSTEVMVQSCASCVPPETNPGVVLGVVMGTMAKMHRDKVTLVISPKIASLGAWLEQLLAESTGKNETGLVPVDGERLGQPKVYGNDRLFVYIRLNSSPDREQDEGVAKLEWAGHPVVRISLEDPIEIGQEFFRWEIAAAVAGSILGINAFDQPDVEASKVATRALSAAYEKTGALPSVTPSLEERGVQLFADGGNSTAIGSHAPHTLDGWLGVHLGRIRAGDYVALNAYLEMNDENERELQAIRHLIRDSTHAATTVGFGPRFLHSTGQLHKGGPNSGVFIQITADDADDLPIPGQKYTFGVLKRLQAEGDYQVLVERGRRILRVHLGKDVRGGLLTLKRGIQAALAR